jgi:hypothetical protein
MMRAGKLKIVTLWMGTVLPIAAGVQAEELTGMITQVEQTGESVQLAGPGVDTVPAAKPWQVVRVGVHFKVPSGARLGVVCSTRSFVRIQGPASWSLSEKSCALGKPLQPADYGLIVPRGGRLRVVPGSLTLERGTRGDEDDLLAPVLLSPRNITLRTLRPPISWVRVPSAVEYQIEWNGGRSTAFSLRLEADKVKCAVGWEGLDICSLPWPADRPDLPPGHTFFLRVSVRQGIAAPWYGARAVKVETLEPDEARKLEARLRDLQDLGLDAEARELARAGLLAESRLLDEAAEIYRQVLASAPSAELEVTFADTYLARGLLRLADAHYRKALDGGDCAVRAAAAFGLGRIEYSLAHYAEASARFREAAEIYTHAKLSEESVAARQALTEADARAPLGGPR